MANFITKLFTKSTPTTGAKFQVRRFNAAIVDRLTSGWLTTTSSINQELKTDLDKLRARSRDLAKNNDYAKKFVNMVVANVVGPNGFNLQSRIMSNETTQDKPANDAIESAFYEWAKKGVCEISGRMSFAEFERALARCFSRDGEYLVRIIRGKAARNRFGFAVQLLDIDRLDTLYNQTMSSNSNAIVMGVEIDAYRKPVAYYLFSSHPSETNQSTRVRERVPAEDIYHDFIYENPEQIRGIPWMSASMLTLHHLGEFEQSALIAARKGANTLGFIVSPDGSTINSDANDDDPINISVPGEYDTLPEGYDFKPYDTKYPDAMLGPFVKNFLRRASSGLNVAYNGLANDLEGVNFSSIRSGVIDEREQWMTIQSWFIDSFMSPMYEEWLGAALLTSAITLPNGSALPASKKEKFSVHTWQGRRWQWVDPMRDIEASLLAIRSGLNSPYIIASQMGLDLDDVMQDLARANANALKLGLPAFAAPAPAAVTPAITPAQEPVDQAKSIVVNVAAPVTNITTPEVRVESPVHIHEKAFYIDAPITTPEPKVTLEATITLPENSLTINPAA
jgi:lambda family phage portal protein